ncbi:hypothetical protein FRC07_009259 [Ceratobasidium sp. 392]|nr:hypothetical protein FRC07_009259 [Ceratobasidium sp. 392]
MAHEADRPKTTVLARPSPIQSDAPLATTDLAEYESLMSSSLNPAAQGDANQDDIEGSRITPRCWSIVQGPKESLAGHRKRASDTMIALSVLALYWSLHYFTTWSCHIMAIFTVFILVRRTLSICKQNTQGVVLEDQYGTTHDTTLDGFERTVLSPRPLRQAYNSLAEQTLATIGERSGQAPLLTPVLGLFKSFTGWNLIKRVAPLAILAVGVSGEDLPGPDHDLKLLGRTFSSAVLYPLKGPLATMRGIESALKHMFENTGSLAAVVLYFTGHTNEDNAFILADGQTIKESTLFEMIHRLRPSTDDPLPVVIVLDSCRARPSESSYDMGLDDNLPHSDLLKSIFLALSEMRTCPANTPRSFMGTLTRHASRAVKIHRAGACSRNKCDVPWNKCACPECLKGGLCSHPQHGDEALIRVLQYPVAWFTGFGNDIGIDRVLRAIEPIYDYMQGPIGEMATEINNKYLKFEASTAMFFKLK